jgi:hypothetical protein
MRWFLIFLLTCTAGFLRAEVPGKLLEQLPKSLADCEASKVQGYDDPKLGSSLSYHQAGLLLTVYAYDLGEKDIPDGIEGKVVKEAFELAMSDIKEAEKQGYYSDVAWRLPYRASHGEGHRVLRARYHLTRQKGEGAGKRFISEIDVFGARGMIIKVRMTGDIENEASHRKTVDKFLPELFKALQPAAKPKTP